MAKDFKNIKNPALQFISTASDLEPDATEQAPAKKVKETKSKRLQLLIYPSVFTACKREADRTGESVNEIINNILKNYFSSKE